MLCNTNGKLLDVCANLTSVPSPIVAVPYVSLHGCVSFGLELLAANGTGSRDCPLWFFRRTLCWIFISIMHNLHVLPKTVLVVKLLLAQGTGARFN